MPAPPPTQEGSPRDGPGQEGPPVTRQSPREAAGIGNDGAREAPEPTAVGAGRNPGEAAASETAAPQGVDAVEPPRDGDDMISRKEFDRRLDGLHNVLLTIRDEMLSAQRDSQRRAQEEVDDRANLNEEPSIGDSGTGDGNSVGNNGNDGDGEHLGVGDGTAGGLAVSGGTEEVVDDAVGYGDLVVHRVGVSWSEEGLLMIYDADPVGGKAERNLGYVCRAGVLPAVVVSRYADESATTRERY